ncbi:MAG: hypothetical protein WD598_06410 [Acidimicrobiia bacterium]
MLAFLAAFGPVDESTAILRLVAVVCWVVAAFFSAPARLRSGGIGLIALGLALWFFPDMWNTVDAAF